MAERKLSPSLADLDQRLRKARESRPGSYDEGGDTYGKQAGLMGVAFKIGVEMVAALIVGGGLGLLLDRWLGSAPWGFITLFFVGSVAALRNVYRSAGNFGFAPPESDLATPATPAGDKETGDDAARHSGQNPHGTGQSDGR